MPLRVRCPECKTVQDVPTGTRPTCPKCGFAGRGAPPAPVAPSAAKTGVKFTRTAPPAAAPAGQMEPEVGWGETRTPEAPEAWAEPAGEDAAAWQAEPAESWGEPPAEAPKKGWFSRKK
ncbi:MAG: hypothetical protein ABR562_00815 [Thermoplasmatota archaeon]